MNNSAATPQNRLDVIQEDFSFLDDWEQRFRHIIDLGKSLEPLSDTDKIETHKIKGCASQVWLTYNFDETNDKLCFHGASDSTLVQGLLAIIIEIYSNSTPKQIIELQPNEIFEKLQLSDALTPSRSNGLNSMANRIMAVAKEYANA